MRLEVPAPGEATIPELIAWRAGRQPDHPALTAVGGETLSYAELHRRCCAFARGLQSLDVRRGERVALLLPNALETPAAWLGVMYAGAVEVPLNVHHKPSMTRDALERFEPVVVVIHHEMAAQLPRELPACVRAVVDVREVPLDDPRGLIPGPVGVGDPAAIIPTSGTTGPSKGVVCSHRHLRRFSLVQAEAYRFTPEDVQYNCSPQFHSSGQVAGVLVSLSAGAHLVIAPRFSRSRFWEDVAAHSATTTLALGGMLSMLESLPPSRDERENGLRLVYAVPAPAAQVARLQDRWSVAIRTNYGSTEQGIIAAQDYDHPLPGSVGRCLPHTRVRICDDDGREAPPGVAGVIQSRPRHPAEVFSGYWGDEQATQASVGPDGWVRSGDRGWLDDEGNLYFLDRSEDVIRRRGEHVSAVELEATIVRHPDVAQAAAVGVPSPLGESDVLVFVVPRPGCEIDPEDLLRFCAAELAYFMVPRYVEILDDLPLTATGKITKAPLRERGVGPATWDREAAGLDVTRDGIVERAGQR